MSKVLGAAEEQLPLFSRVKDCFVSSNTNCFVSFRFVSSNTISRKTTASAPVVCRRISVATLTFRAGFPQTDFDTKLANFFLKLVFLVFLKELQSNFLISTLRLFQKLSHK